MIPFNKPPKIGIEKKYLLESLEENKLSGDGSYSKKCHKWFMKHLKCKSVFLTASCTQALEMAAILLDINKGDEVIMPSFTFSSTANAFVLRGARIVFVDIRPDTMNIDENLIEKAITSKTKVIVPVHYAGISCEMDKIMSIAKRHKLYVVEDAAQGMMSTYKGKPLGTFGNLSAYSFHETKNYTSGGEGGLMIVNDKSFKVRAEIVREKGTNRSQFFRGEVDKYTWVDVGGSYLMSEIQAAYLWGELQKAAEINKDRLSSWKKYFKKLKRLEEKKYIQLPTVPKNCKHNGHIFYIKVKNINERTDLINFLRLNNVYAVFHYIPLHKSIAGLKFGRFIGKDNFTTRESRRLIRLPMYYGLKEAEINKVVRLIDKFYEQK